MQQKTREIGSGSRSKEDRVQSYLDRLERLVIDPEKKQKREMFGDEPRPRALHILREMVMNKYVRPNKGKMAEGAAIVEERAAREMGIEAHYGEEELAERGKIAVEDLEKSLDNWISYLSDANEPYPTWFRYYVFRNVLDLGDYDKDKGEFTKRSQGSTRLFPDIDRGALAYVQQMIEVAKDEAMLQRLQKAQQAAANGDVPQDQLITKEKAGNFAKLSFAKQYADGIRQAGEITPEMRQETQGAWVKYQKGTDPTALWASLQNKGTAWCTKGFATAEKQLEGGDFYVYYTSDRQGKPTIPRIAIRMQGDSVGEVRGVADNDQNLEGSMAEIAEEKMKDLPGSERYKKASADMKHLTAIEKKVKSGGNLTRDDMVFLYEIDTPIEGFGYERDPRITELRKQRNPKEDAPVVLECQSQQIAWSQKDISEQTRAYIGPLFSGIFEKDIEHIYTTFPEAPIRKFGQEIGGQSARDLQKDLKKDQINISGVAEKMLKHKDFTTLKNPEKVTLVRLKVRDLFSDERTRTTDQIYQRAAELGLELCPAEVGPHLRLKYSDQPIGEWICIGMEPIVDSDGNPRIFDLGRFEDGLWLRSSWARPDDGWSPDDEFVFRLRKSEA